VGPDTREAAVEPGVDGPELDGDAAREAGMDMLLFCPMAWAVPQQGPPVLTGGPPTVRMARTYHEWRQKLDWLNEHSDRSNPAIGHAGYYCTRCMSEVDIDGRLRYTGTP